MHEIFQDRAAYAVTPAWHKIGYVKQDGRLTASEVIEHAKIDYKVVKVPMYVPEFNMVPTFSAEGMGEGLMVDMENLKVDPSTFKTVAIWEDGSKSWLGTVGEQYEVVQNKELFSVFDPLIEDNEAVFEAAGVLYGGRTVWMLAQLPGVIEVGVKPGQDQVVPYLLCWNSHDGSSSLCCKLTYIRVVCANTLAAAEWEATKAIRIRHSKNIRDRMAQATHTLGLVKAAREEIEPAMRAMATHKLSLQDRAEYICDILGIDLNSDKPLTTKQTNRLAEVSAILDQGYGVLRVDGSEQTVWGVYNAITEWADHVKPVNKSTDKLGAMIDGSISKLKERAFTKALELVSA